MARLFVVTGIFTAGLILGLCLRGSSPTAMAGGGLCASQNGDVNASGSVDLTDAIAILTHLFLGEPSALVPLCAPPAIATSLLQTGQTACYDLDEELGWVEVPCGEATCPGQDASYLIGCPDAERLTDNGDGTVSDSCTGLVWQKDTGDVNGDGQSTDQDHTPWCEALTYCENLSFAGHDDWRLPNVRELQSIVHYAFFNPSIDPVFSAFGDGGVYWTSTSTSGAIGASRGWGVYFYNGFVINDFKDRDYFARAVRSGP